MDFEDTPEEAAFRAEVRAFLDKSAERKNEAKSFHRGRYIPEHNIPETVRAAKEWQAKKADAGFAGITWPKQWAGGGGTPVHQVSYNQEKQAYLWPRGVF